jgi:hypothetical protein
MIFRQIDTGITEQLRLYGDWRGSTNLSTLCARARQLCLDIRWSTNGHFVHFNTAGQFPLTAMIIGRMFFNRYYFSVQNTLDQLQQNGYLLYRDL